MIAYVSSTIPFEHLGYCMRWVDISEERLSKQVSPWWVVTKSSWDGSCLGLPGAQFPLPRRKKNV